MIPDHDFIDADCLLRNLKNGMELLLSNEERSVGLNSLIVRSVGEILAHGLREKKYGYWHIVRELTHSSTRQCIARALKHVTHNNRRGLFWIYYTLIEGSLDSYMQCLVTDRVVLDKHYLDYALLRDTFCSTKFVLLLTSLAQINILPLDSTSRVGLSLEVVDNRPLPYDWNALASTTFLPDSPSTVASSPTDSGVHGSMDNFSPTICTPIQEKSWPCETTLTPLEAAFSDCSLSSAAEPSVVRRRKRVSFHETVIGDGPKGTVWERRSADVETMAWWKCNQTVEDHGEDALDMERGVPEGSDDPPAIYESHKMDDNPPQIMHSTPIKWKVPAKAVKSKLIERRGRGHLMPVYPGPVPIPDVPPDDDEVDLLDVPMMIQVSGTQLALERLLESTVYKIFKMVDVEGNSYVCSLSKEDVCLLSLTNDKALHLHRIHYQDMNHIFVGPSSEHITFEGDLKFLLTSRGEEFCSWLHYAACQEGKKDLDFIRISPQDAFSEALKNMKNMNVEDVIHSTWAIVCDTFNSSDLAYNDHLMFSLGNTQKFWEPAFVEISKNGLLEVRPCSKGLKALSLPLSSCSSCDRVLSGRPHTFLLKFGMSRQPMTLCLAAPDDYVMSSWMQAILIAVASCKSKANRESIKTGCTEGHHLIASAGFVALVNSARDKVVSRALLNDIAGLLVGPAYVILELDCHEVEDKASDWVLYFYCEELKTSFINLLTELRPHLQQMIFEHKVMSCNWVRCETEQSQLASSFELIISHVKSL
uniref:RUN domain-containing protein n=3 Tax=Lygus hesperus TaxID=30085 RepID=A0A146L0L9_LYGHE